MQGYERIVSSSNDMLALLDKNFVYLAVNERYAKAFGMTRGELVGSTVSKIFGKEFFESVIQPYAEKCMQGHEIRYQDWFDFPTYGKRSMEIAYDPFRGPDNEINGFVVNGRDITDRKQAEEALRESQEHYKNFFENALVGFFRTKISDGTFIEINSKAAEQLGLPIEKIIGKMRSADLYRNADQRKELLTILKRDGVVHDFETDMTLLDGRNIIFSISAKAYPEQDYLEGTVVDITERKQTEEELRKLAEVVKYSSELVNMADLDGNMIFLNKAGGEMLGIDPDNVQDTNIMEVIPEKWKNIVQNELLPALMSGEHWNGELQYRNIKTGKLTDVHAMAFTVKDPKTGKPQFLANVSLDITETKRLREQESRALRLESAGRVAGQIAHDFNNLLAPLVAYPDFIKEGLPENHPTLKYINGMEKSANQIAEINQQLLTLSRRGHYNQEVLNLNEVIQFAIGEMGILPQTAVIETDFAKNLMNIRGGASQINRILFNLIHNARDAMQDVGNIIIKTENYYADNPTTNFGHIPKGEYVKITISDIGCGIPEDIKHNIFDPFYTTKSSDRRRGSGLGLSVVDAVMKDHDGYIDLQSSVGDGTSFYLYFPITRETIDAACEEEILGGTESILVVDDDKTQCDVALMLLNKLGYNATAINSGEQAIQYIKKNPQDLLLLDMIMPDGIDGTETFRQVIEMYPNQRAIIVSGYAESSRVEEARQLGIEMYIRKPLTLKLVASCIRKVLDKKEDLVSIS